MLKFRFDRRINGEIVMNLFITITGIVDAHLTPGGYSFIWAIWDVLLDRVWFFGLAVLNRVYNLTWLCPKESQNLS